MTDSAVCAAVQGCRFCTYLGGGAIAEIDTPWLHNSRYGAIVSKGALVPGWTLVCPRAHELNLSGHYLLEEFWEFNSAAHEIVRCRYGEVRLFEHGVRSAGSPTGCGTDHAHMHMVPLDFSLVDEAQQFNDSLVWRTCHLADVSTRSAGKEYLFVADHFQGQYTTGAICLLDSPISQFFRKVIASRLGMSTLSDYRQHPMLNNGAVSAIDLMVDASRGNRVGA